jgi:hypothetical protein
LQRSRFIPAAKQFFLVEGAWCAPAEFDRRALCASCASRA